MTPRLLVLLPLIVLATAGQGAETEEAAGPVVRMSAGIERFCRGDNGLAFIAGEADVPEADPDRVGPRGRIVVSQSREGVNVLIVPPADVDHMFSAQMEFDSFLFGATRTDCPAQASLLPILGTGVEGLEFGVDENGEPEIRFNR